MPPPMVTTTTTTTVCKCTTCGAITCYKRIVHQVTTCFPNSPPACPLWCYAGGPSAGNTPRPPHQDIVALPDDSNTWGIMAPDPSPPVGQLSQHDYYQIKQQLKELETQSDEVLALRLQLEEYMVIAKSKKDNAGRNWFIPLPENMRNILVMARDALNSLVHISTPPKARDQ